MKHVYTYCILTICNTCICVLKKTTRFCLPIWFPCHPRKMSLDPPLDLSWTSNTKSVTKRAQQRLHFKRRLKKVHIPKPIFNTFYRGTIQSILTRYLHLTLHWESHKHHSWPASPFPPTAYHPSIQKTTLRHQEQVGKIVQWDFPPNQSGSWTPCCAPPHWTLFSTHFLDYITLSFHNQFLHYPVLYWSTLSIVFILCTIVFIYSHCFQFLLSLYSSTILLYLLLDYLISE